MDNSLQYYQQKMEQFYDDLIDEVRKERCYLTSEDPCFEDYIDEHDLLIFEDTLQGMEYDDSIEKILNCLAKKGYKLALNFQEKDVVLGNVIVRLCDRWFAFGNSRNGVAGDRCVTEIWPLRYVLPRLEKMEAQPKQMFPV